MKPNRFFLPLCLAAMFSVSPNFTPFQSPAMAESEPLKDVPNATTNTQALDRLTKRLELLEKRLDLQSRANRFLRPKAEKSDITTIRINHAMNIPSSPDPTSNNDLKQQMRQKIYDKIHSECAILENAFQKSCKIKNISMNDTTFRARGNNRITANVTYELSEKKDGTKDDEVEGQEKNNKAEGPEGERKL